MNDQRLLLVDDDRSNSAAVAAILAPLGYAIDVAIDGDSALELAGENTYDLAIVDYQMPGMDGVELFRQLHKRYPRTRGIMLTSYTTIDKVFPAIDNGIERVLAKPVDAKVLIPLVRELTGPGTRDALPT